MLSVSVPAKQILNLNLNERPRRHFRRKPDEPDDFLEVTDRVFVCNRKPRQRTVSTVI